MKLNKNEYITSLNKTLAYTHIISITENGFGKKTYINDYPLTKRANKGIFCIKTNNKTGNLIKTESINENNDLLLITNNGIILRINTQNIPCSSRHTKGVSLIKLKSNEKLIDIRGETNETMHNN